METNKTLQKSMYVNNVGTGGVMQDSILHFPKN